MQAKYYNPSCNLCKQPIEIGAEIVKDKRSGHWVHAVCPSEQAIAASVERLFEQRGAALAEAVASAPMAVVTVVQAAPPPDKPFTPSAYQLDIFKAIAATNRHIVVEALAGSGKTTTLRHAVKYVAVNVAMNEGVISPEYAEDAMKNPRPYEELIGKLNVAVGFCAFNKHIADTLKATMPAWCWTGTVHGLGWGVLRQAFPYLREPNGDKVNDLMNQFPQLRNDRGLPTKERMVRRVLRQNVAKLVSLAKAILLDYSDPALVSATIERYGLEFTNGDEELAVALLPQLMERCKDITLGADFDDMIWLPLVLNLKVSKFDYLFGDEVQDWNASQLELVHRAIKPGGRLIAVGDRHQSLYGFRGADVDAIPNIIARMDALVLPLSITYRCPLAHVALAQQLVPSLEARPNAPDGVVKDLQSDKAIATLEAGDMVLCRVNAPLVPLAFSMIRQGKKAVVRGRDIGKGLIELVKRFDADNSVVTLESRLREWFFRERQRLLDRERDAQAQALEDKFDTLEALIAEHTTVDELVERIGSLFSDDVVGVVFSSVHRAKGLEAQRVFILSPELMPHPSAKQPWQAIQEGNIQYVALTRSLSELYFVTKKEVR